MTLGEILKRGLEWQYATMSRIKYRRPEDWPYSLFAEGKSSISFESLPKTNMPIRLEDYWIFNFPFNLRGKIDWYFSGNDGTRWPRKFHTAFNHRSGNPYGDIRINWELNRMQFLPAVALADEELAKSIIKDWLKENPYLYGPSYKSSMEIALRWIQIYWATCLFKVPVDTSLLNSLSGLAVASGKFIKQHLSTHSSAGNHLIVEAVGLFWIGKALQKEKIGQRYLAESRDIIHSQALRQLSPDGTNREQSFWYLGFVLDALFHYFLLESAKNIPKQVWARVEKSLEFMNDLTLENGDFFDYGDRDDGYIFREDGQYTQAPFLSLLSRGAFFYDRRRFLNDSNHADRQVAFWSKKLFAKHRVPSNQPLLSGSASIRSYPDGGMTILKWGKATMLFRHASLGLEPTSGHGHADALSILLFWGTTPVLIDLGSGQYNGHLSIRNAFRSTLFHNTVQVAASDQAGILGSFLWDKSYDVFLTAVQEHPYPLVTAYHTGYKDKYGIIHTRTIEWTAMERILIHDSFSGPGKHQCTKAFHLGNAVAVDVDGNSVRADLKTFSVAFTCVHDCTINTYFGSTNPFLGWRSTVYGKWEPIYSILCFWTAEESIAYTTELRIIEGED